MTIFWAVICTVIQSCEANVEGKDEIELEIELENEVEGNGENNVNGCEDVVCTEIFMHISLKLEYPNEQPVLLDSSKVFWISENRFLEQNTVSWNEARVWGSYLIVNDLMRKELQGKEEIMHFTGYLNGEIVCERDVPVSADCCHVIYLGAESLIQIIARVENDNSLLIEEMNKSLPVINEFLADLPSNSEEQSFLNDGEKLQSLVEWLKSKSCVVDATVLCNSCIYTLPVQSEISISVKYNEKTEVVILDILMSNPLRAIRFHEHY